MILTAAEDIELIRQAGRIDAEVLEQVAKLVAPGVTTWELDQFADRALRERGAIPTFKGYRNFPCSICVSVNEEVVHGIPSKNRVLKDGDIVSLDLGATIRRQVNGKQQDFIGDTAITIAVGSISPRLEKLLDDTKRALYAGIRACRAGASLDDIGGAIEDIAKEAGYGIVREYGGHGIGFNYHEDPFILNYRSGSRTKLKPGMVIAIEPMFNLGGDRVRVKQDGWTVVTQDYKPSAHFEHSLLITEGAPEILTRRPGEEVP
ncbi:MAG TPA: type I methionyl aminopeptidase [Candidatus Obscuribacterales bacterium]